VGTYETYEGTREVDATGLIAVPGLIDTHLHIESTQLTPREFARAALPRGTTTAIWDPHEIANVLGHTGLEWVLDCAGRLPLDVRVMLPSCVPATHLETSGAALGAEDLARYMDHPQVLGLAEMMNFPGVLNHDPGVVAKLVAFADRHIDGHSPLMGGRDLNAYLACGVRTCHECTTTEEGREKLRKGMQVLVREGSVSKDVEALAALIDEATWPFLSLCTDDRNPLDIEHEGHLDFLVRKAIACGAPTIPVYRAATWGAAKAFGFRDRGLVAPGYRADVLLVSDLDACAVEQVIAGGKLLEGDPCQDLELALPPGTQSIQLESVQAETFKVPATGPSGPVIGILPRSLITEHLTLSLPYADGCRQPDVEQDVLTVAVLARHGKNDNVGRGFVKGFGLRRGALASSVGHDSHNVIVVGSDRADMALAVNRLIDLQGGFVLTDGGQVIAELPLPIAGLMSDLTHQEVAQHLVGLKAAIAERGCHLDDPCIQLAFLPLPVIPHLKITDKGLVDVDRFELVA
jgi:adenine deaminase